MTGLDAGLHRAFVRSPVNIEAVSRLLLVRGAKNAPVDDVGATTTHPDVHNPLALAG
jgi:hypothetical protein